MPLGSKNGEMNDFYELLNVFINTHESSTTERQDRKNRIMNNIKQLCNQYLVKVLTYDSEKVKDKEKRVYDYKQFEIIENRDQEPKSTEKEETETKISLMGYKSHYGLN